ncbi:MAG: ribosomal-processing cysteine protease Prp [Spirochaetales bacterium]|nr:ribosomal-processing cysteine protease Prp [Spirochaetales bacterium]
MINIRIAIDNKGNLGTLRAEGHAMNAEKGSNIVCAAVSAQLRAVVRALQAKAGIEAVISADEPGFLELIVKSGLGNSEWLEGATDVLLAGLLETERDFPDECSIKLFKNDLRS